MIHYVNPWHFRCILCHQHTTFSSEEEALEHQRMHDCQRHCSISMQKQDFKQWVIS